jgi:hypothetical protein
MSIENITADEAARVFVDDQAARRFEDDVLYAGASAVTDEERAAIDRVVAARCRAENGVAARLERFVGERLSEFFAVGDGPWRLAAATGDAAEEAPAREDVQFVFVSDEKAPPGDAWRAVMEVPGRAQENPLLALRVFNADGAPAGNGLFTVAGTTVIVEAGAAALPLDVFLVGIRDSAVAFQRENGAPVPGNLIFF